MRIDCAVSLCDRTQFSYSWVPGRDYTAADLAPILARNRFDGAILIAQLEDPAETEWLLGLGRQHDWVRGVMTRNQDQLEWDRWQRNALFLGVDSPSPSLASVLARRELICALPPADAIRALDAASDLRLAVRAMAGLAFAEPEFDAWALSLEPLQKSRALIQIDGLLNFAGPVAWQADRHRPWVQYLLKGFGPHRLSYGSGWPLSMPEVTWKESLACFTQCLGAQPMDDRSLIIGENAAKFYTRLTGGSVY